MNDPMYHLPVVPRFEVSSTDVADRQELPSAQMSAHAAPFGKDISPDLSWSGAPPETQSYTVTLYDPDAPSGSGFWHWALVDIPSSVTELPSGAGSGSGDHLPEGAFHIPNDERLTRFVGAAPPPGDARHRYFFVVQALNIDHVEKIGVRTDSTPSWLGFNINTGGHLLARAILAPWAEIPAL